MLARNERRHERLPGRQIEGAHRCAERGEHVDRPDRGQAAKCQHRERQRDERGADLGDQHQRPPVPGVRDDAAEHREDDDWHDAHEADQPERDGFAARRHEQETCHSSAAFCMIEPVIDASRPSQISRKLRC